MAAPLVQLQARSCTYAVANQLTELLKKHPEVRLEARGKKVAEMLAEGGDNDSEILLYIS